MAQTSKNRASRQAYQSTKQLVLPGFETPFEKNLDPNNRWVKLSKNIPWDDLVSLYLQQLNQSNMGASTINPRIVLGSIIIKHLCDLPDREVIAQIQENVYMQYFVGLSSFTNEAVFDPSLFVEIRNRLGLEQINQISERIMRLSMIKSFGSDDKMGQIHKNTPSDNNQDTTNSSDNSELKDESTNKTQNKGKMIIDATACPQNIAYPTDLGLLNDAREKAEELIDVLYKKKLHGEKPRTYRKIARKQYLQTAQKKKKGRKEIRRAVTKQLHFLTRDIKHIDMLLDQYATNPLSSKQLKYLFVIQTLQDQQKLMLDHNTHHIEDRIVSIHQPHVRPIVRGKANAYVEFGSKINVSLMNNIAFLDDFSWDAFNEGTRLMNSVEKYKARFGCYPAEILADKIYCTRENRATLKSLNIVLKAKPLGRPSKEEPYQVTPGERNPIEGLFGQAKTAYGLNLIRARLKITSESWIASIILVLNLVKLARMGYLCLIKKWWTFSVRLLKIYVVYCQL